LAEQGDRGEGRETSDRPDRRVDPAQIPVPERRDQPYRQERPGDLVRKEPGLEVDVGERDERCGEREVSEGPPVESGTLHERHGEDAGRDLDQDVARADADAALPATCPEEQPGDDRNVVVPGDRLATAGAAASRRYDALPRGNARDHD